MLQGWSTIQCRMKHVETKRASESEKRAARAMVCDLMAACGGKLLAPPNFPFSDDFLLLLNQELCCSRQQLLRITDTPSAGIVPAA